MNGVNHVVNNDMSGPFTMTDIARSRFRLWHHSQHWLYTLYPHQFPSSLSSIICIVDNNVSLNRKWEYNIKHNYQLSLLSSAGREMSTSQNTVMLCGWGAKAGWSSTFVNKRVGGRWSLVNTCDRSFSVAGLKVWNSLPVTLRQPDVELRQFKRLLKTFLFGEAAAH